MLFLVLFSVAGSSNQRVGNIVVSWIPAGFWLQFPRDDLNLRFSNLSP